MGSESRPDIVVIVWVYLPKNLNSSASAVESAKIKTQIVMHIMSSILPNQEGSMNFINVLTGLGLIGYHAMRGAFVADFSTTLDINVHITSLLIGDCVTHVVGVTKLHCLAIDALVVDGVEAVVVSKLREGNLAGLHIAQFLCVLQDGSNTVRCVWCVAPGRVLTGFQQSSPGEYEPAVDAMCVTAPAIVNQLCDSWYPAQDDRYYIWWCCLVWLWSIFGFVHLRFCLIPSSSVLYFLARIAMWFGTLRARFVTRRIALTMIDHINSERLNTLSNLGSSAARRLIQSSLQKRFLKKWSQNTISVTVDYFGTITTRESDEIMAAACGSSFSSNLEQLILHHGGSVWCAYVGPGFFDSQECADIPAVVDNRKLTLQPRSRGCRFEGGILQFETAYSKPVSVYFYGPHYASASVKYTVKSTVNVSAALTRLTNSRANEEGLRVRQDYVVMLLLGYPDRVEPTTRHAARRFKAFEDWGLPRHEFNRFQQQIDETSKAVYVALRGMYTAYMAHLLLIMNREDFQRVSTVCKVDLAREYADQPHPKKALRQLCVESMDTLPSLWDKGLTVVQGKVKWETAKYKKVARQFVSLGDAATLYWPDLSGFLKNVFNEEYVSTNCVFRFVKEVTPDEMDAFCFNVGEYHCGGRPFNVDLFYYHSDDSLYTTTVSVCGELFTMSVGLDIAKCDVSHGPGIFLLVFACCVHLGFDPTDLYPLFAQLQADVMVRHPDNKCDEVAFFELSHITLFSGHTLTTQINNFGCLLIGMILNIGFQIKRAFETRESIFSYITELASMVGYEVKVDCSAFTRVGDPRPMLSTVTFLKHFPVWAHDRFVAMKCLSTIVRNYGIADEVVDLVVRRREILMGLSVYHRCEVVTRLLAIVGGVHQPDRVAIDDDDVAFRYGVTTQDLLEGLDLLFRTDDVVLVAHPALHAICSVGYGLDQAGD